MSVIRILRNIESYSRQQLTTNKPLWLKIVGPALMFTISLLLVFYFDRSEQVQLRSIFILTSVLTAIFFGFLPSIFTSFLSALCIDYFFIPPLNSVFDSLNSYMRFFIYISISILISLISRLVKQELINSKKLNIELQAINNQKNHLMAMVAHDLRNPLGNILGVISSMKSDADFPKQYKEELELIEKTASLSLGIVAEVMNYSITDNIDFKINTKEFYLDKLLEDVIQVNKIAANKKYMEISFINQIGSTLLIADKVLLHRVFQNLLDNAIKYSFPNTPISVTLKSLNNEVLIEFKDNGPGISEAEQLNLFKPFYKTSNKPTGGESSTGLGLAGVARIVELHRGRVTIESERMKGSIFRVYIPYSN